MAVDDPSLWLVCIPRSPSAPFARTNLGTAPNFRVARDPGGVWRIHYERTPSWPLNTYRLCRMSARISRSSLSTARCRRRVGKCGSSWQRGANL